jgi:UDP-N-acetylmuramoyl-tripeptide--D-alanyl-D-alanine ligase
LVAVGELAAFIAQEAEHMGIETDWVPDGDAAAEILQTMLEPGDVVLVKASRALALDRVVDRLTVGPVPAVAE